MTMQRAARLQAAGQIEIHDIAVPAAGADGIVVQVAACGICGTDLSFYRAPTVPPGSVLGHEFSGRIVAIGKDVDGLALGDRVVVNPMTQGVGLGRADGAFSHYVRVDAPERDKTVFVLPETVSDEAGALVEPFSVGLHAVNSAGLRATDRVVIFGAGMIGQCVLAALRAKGVRDILVIDYSERRLQLAMQLGARAVHDPRNGSARAFVGHHFREEMTRFADEPLAEADVAFDCAGVAAVLTDGLRSLRRRGKFVIVADHHGPATIDMRLLMLRRITMIGVLAYDEEFAEAIDLMARSVVDLMPLVTHRFALEDLAEAFRAQLDTDNAVKVMMTHAIG